MNLNHVGKERKAIRFSTEAAEAWFNYAKWVESHINPMGIYQQAKDHASKLAENVGRVAALLHFFEGYDGDISFNTFIAACHICNSCSEYFVKKFNALPQEEIDAQLLLVYGFVAQISLELGQSHHISLIKRHAELMAYPNE